MVVDEFEVGVDDAGVPVDVYIGALDSIFHHFPIVLKSIFGNLFV